MNKHMDEAYLLLGKSRFYQSKFLPALEAFNFIKLKFRGKKAYYEALLWSAKTQIRIENYALAASELEDILANRNFPKKYRSEVYAHYSDALLKQKKYTSAEKNMKTAIGLEKDMRIKTRYAYILAQIYRLDGRGLRSTETFDKVIEQITLTDAELKQLDGLSRIESDIDEEETNYDYFPFVFLLYTWIRLHIYSYSNNL